MADSQEEKSLPKILVVDDNDDIRTVLNARLKAASFEVIDAADWNGVVDALGWDAPDAVILDLNLPVVDGVSIADYIRDTLRHELPIIVYSGFPDLEERVRAAGVSAFVSKSEPLEKLIEEVKKCLSQQTKSKENKE